MTQGKLCGGINSDLEGFQMEMFLDRKMCRVRVCIAKVKECDNIGFSGRRKVSNVFGDGQSQVIVLGLEMRTKIL